MVQILYWARRLSGLLAFFILALSASGQVQISGKLFSEKFCKKGEEFIEKIIVINPSEKDVEILLIQKDANLLKRSNSSWFQLPGERIFLKARHKVIIPIKILVPETVESGAYWSSIFVRPLRHNVEEQNNESVSIVVQYKIVFVSIISGGKKDIEIVETNVEKNKLTIVIKNIGDDLLKLKAQLELEGVKKIISDIRIFPNELGKYEYDISELPDKLYKDIMVVFRQDDVLYITLKKITFRKGEKPEPPELIALESERLGRKKRRGKPFHLGLSLGSGSRQKLTANLIGNINVRNFNLNFGGSHSEYLENDFNSFRISGNWRPSKFFSLGIGTMAFLNDKIRYASMLRTGISFKSTRLNVGYGLEYKILNLNLSQRLFKKFSLRFYYMKSPWREDWQASVYVPIF